MLASGAAPAIPWLRLVLSFLFCIAVAGGASLALRRYRGKSGTPPWAALFSRTKPAPLRRLRILETRRASQYGDLCLVEIDTQLYFLALTPGGAVLLDRPGYAADNGGEVVT